MSKEIITFSDIEIEKTSFTAIKVLFLEDLDIDNALVMCFLILFGAFWCFLMLFGGC